MVVAALGAHDQVASAPVVTMPAGPALAWAPVLDAIQRSVGIVRASGTVLQSASAAGRGGIDALSEETLALLNQRGARTSAVFPAAVAFDCFAQPGGGDGPGEGADSPTVRGIKRALARLLGPDVALSVASVQVPVFAGEGSVIDLEPREPIAAQAVAKLLQETRGIEVWEGDLGPSMRDAVGREDVLVGPVRSDEGVGRGVPHIGLWLAADPVRLAAVNALALLRLRFGLD
jgi:aspartate-semialdehyde dehydrogenase